MRAADVDTRTGCGTDELDGLEMETSPGVKAERRRVKADGEKQGAYRLSPLNQAVGSASYGRELSLQGRGVKVCEHHQSRVSVTNFFLFFFSIFFLIYILETTYKKCGSPF